MTINPTVPYFEGAPVAEYNYIIFQWDGTLEQMALIARHNAEVGTSYLQMDGSMFLKWNTKAFGGRFYIVMPGDYFVIDHERNLLIKTPEEIAAQFILTLLGKYE